MPEKFDPYYKWLGIPPKDQPPSHYRLLGLDVFESDPEVIDRAANRLMDYLHSISDGEHLSHAQALLNAIAAARLCLLDDEDKAVYDERLRAQDAAKRPEAASVFDDPEGDDSSERSGERSSERSARHVRGTRSRRTAPSAPPPALALPPIPPPVQGQAGPHERRGRGKKKSSVVLAIGLVFGVAAVGGLAVYLVLLMNAETQKAAAPSKSDTLASARGQKEAKVADGSSAVPAVARAPEATKTAAKTDDSPPFTFDPSKALDPPTFPTNDDRPPLATIQLFESLQDAIKKKDVKGAIDLLEKYLSNPLAPEAARAGSWLQFLKGVASDEIVVGFLNELSDAEFNAAEAGTLPFKKEIPLELVELLKDAMQRNVAEAKRRRGMAKGKVPPGTNVAGSNPKLSTPDAKTPSPKTPEKAAEPPGPDPLSKPVEFLTSQELTKRGSQWQLDEEAAIAAMSGLADLKLEKPYTTAVSRTVERLKTINKIRAELKDNQQKVDEAKSRNKKAPPKMVQYLNEWGPKYGDAVALGGNLELRSLLLDRLKPRNDLLLAVLAARKVVDPVDEKYAALAKDPRVAQAEGKLPGEKVGPSTKFTQARAKFAKTEELVLTDETPLFLRGKDTMLSVLINDVPVDVAFVPQNQNFNVITGELAKKLGIEVPPTAEKAKIGATGKDGKKKDVDGLVVTVASVRLGKHVLKNLEFIVTGPDGAEFGSGLEYRAFAGFRIEPDYDNFVFKIRPQDAPEPKPAEETAPAKEAPAKTAPAKANPAKAAPGKAAPAKAAGARATP